MTDPTHQRRGHALALLQHASRVADDLGYRVYLDSEKGVKPLYERLGYAVVDNVEQTSPLIPMVRPARQ